MGYLSGKATAKLLNVNVNIPLLLVASIIPDVDLLIPGLEHRGPTHSLIICGLLLIPALVLHGKRVAPYFAALAQHSLIGDYITGEIMLLWPLTSNWIGQGIQITSLTNILVEWAFFLTCFIIMLKTKDVLNLLRPHPSNLTLSIPVFAVFLPAFFSFPLHVPLQLIIPHLTYLTIFSLSILIDIKAILKICVHVMT